jgi:hypothetical protein
VPVGARSGGHTSRTPPCGVALSGSRARAPVARLSLGRTPLEARTADLVRRGAGDLLHKFRAERSLPGLTTLMLADLLLGPRRGGCDLSRCSPTTPVPKRVNLWCTERRPSWQSIWSRREGLV